MLKKFPFYKQYDEMDCGPASLRIVCKYFGKDVSLDYLRTLSNTTRAGSSLLGISEAAEKVGFRTTGAKISFNDLAEESPLPCIAHWQQKHFVVIYKISKPSFFSFIKKRKNETIFISDPAHGLLTYTKEEFLKNWAVANEEGIILALEPGIGFDTAIPEEQADRTHKGLWFIGRYLLRYRQLMVQLLVGLLAGSMLQLIFPFLTQNIVDIGIRQHNLHFIYLVLLAQLFLFLGKTSIEILRGYILMHLSTRININLLTDFFIKLMKLPLGFFDTKMTGDILQRINDYQRVESFLTSGTLNMVFSFINLTVFSIVLFIYSPLIFGVFIAGTILYFIWITYFMKKRASLDYKRFSQLSENQEKNLELILGMQEIKLHNAERKKRWQWEDLQVKLFKINLKALTLGQVQTSGASVINELKNIIISFLAARLVLTGDSSFTLGVMLAVSYIIGQLNSPVLQLVDFIKSWQDARLSIDRINEIHNKADEEPAGKVFTNQIPKGDIIISNLNFRYQGTSMAEDVLSNVSITIPRNKVTAIVGSSGSGKTTLMKLLLKFYEPVSGSIKVGGSMLSSISHHAWRDTCGVVMQEGYIFNDTIAHNIAVRDDEIDTARLKKAAQMANIHDHIMEMPLHYNTKIGQSGSGLSTGQKQRILIARAIYKNPDVLFFDEATSALDARNEKIIVENLEEFYKGKTVVVIAHRLSTVKHADNIIVLEKGRIIEIGNHRELVEEKGFYFNLVKNQLELGS
jgi:ATP-binding cassette, subfamily B, bacterial